MLSKKLCYTLKLLVYIFLDPDDVNLWHFKFGLLDITEFIVWNMGLQRNWDWKIRVCGSNSIENIIICLDQQLLWFPYFKRVWQRAEPPWALYRHITKHSALPSTINNGLIIYNLFPNYYTLRGMYRRFSV